MVPESLNSDTKSTSDLKINKVAKKLQILLDILFLKT